MSRVKDPKIKLFGKTIQLPENPTTAAADEAGEPGSAWSCEPAVGDSSNQNPACSSDSVVEDSSFFSGDAEKQESIKTLSVPKQDHSNKETRPEHLEPEELKDSNTTQPTTTESNEPSNSDASMKTSKTDEDRTESTSNNNSNAKALKKPDKIIPCPRCNSMDTKFCYFNNYNVNQPRYFCKNCQRYWTSGGTMRNVPIGAGRRKNKNPSISQFHHLTVPEALNPNGIHHHSNGTVLTFGSESPLCESIGSVLNILKNGPHKPEEPKENGDNDHKDKVGGNTRLSEPIQLCNSFSYPGPHWPYPWNPVHWGPTGSFSGPLYPAAQPCWGWSVPWVITPAAPAPSALGPNLRTLGKHSREDDVDVKKNTKEEEMVKESNPKKCLWVPKTLRIDDPGDAAKSSIWETLGIKNDGVGGGGVFKAFQTETKGDEKARVLESSTML